MRPGPLRAPLSKSDAQRALVLAHALSLPRPSLGGGPATSLPADVRVVADALERFSAPGPIEVDCGDGGAPFRLLLGQAALRTDETHFFGSRRLGERPHAALFTALRDGLGPMGLRLAVGDPWPVVVHGVAPSTTPSLIVAADESSQPLSSLLLLAAAVARRTGPITVEARGPIASPGYLALTLSWLRRGGLRCTRRDEGFTIELDAPVEALPAVPRDWSSTAYLLLAAWASGGWVEDVDREIEHPDRAILDVLAGVGLEVELADGHATVRGRAHGSLDVSAIDAPDLMPTVAALACVLPEPSRLRDVAILCGKESDRLCGIERMVAAVGGTVEHAGGALRVVPPKRTIGPDVAPIEIETEGDHRRAMAGATLALLMRRCVAIEGAEHVQKSFPAFWDELRRIGVRIDDEISSSRA
jgi:3-phosphoshikimate 1-carboxyvinyltransferase